MPGGRVIIDPGGGGETGGGPLPTVGAEGSSGFIAGDVEILLEEGLTFVAYPDQRRVVISAPDFVPVGAILAWTTGVAAPAGFLACDGAAVSRATYADLFAVVGTAYGVGDGVTTFNVPSAGPGPPPVADFVIKT